MNKIKDTLWVLGLISVTVLVVGMVSCLLITYGALPFAEYLVPIVEELLQ